MTKLIQFKQSTRYPTLTVKKYTKQVFFKNLWNSDPELIESRGHVLDQSGQVVVNPMTKCFNYQENGTMIDRDELCLMVEKINGFMCAATYVPSVGEVVISTTGSLDSDFVGYAEEFITPQIKQYIKANYATNPVTFIFEICHPIDPHIIVEKHGAYLLGMRRIDDTSPYFSDAVKEAELDRIAADMGVMRPIWRDNVQFGHILKLASRSQNEGFMVYGQSSGTSLKIKTPYYKTLKAIARKSDIMSLDKQRVDEEYYPLLDHLVQISDKFNALDEQSKLEYIKEFLNHE